MSDVARARLFTPASLARLREVADVDGPLAEAEVLLTGWGCPPVDGATLAGAPRLRAIVHAAGSARAIVTPACWERGIVVSTAAAANAQPVAEFTLAAILLANKGVLAAALAYRERRARVDALAEYPDIGNRGKAVGLVGASRVGRRVIELLAPFELRVIVADPFLDDAEAARLGVERRELEALLAEAHVVSLHAPSLPATRHMLDRRRLALMRDGAVLINTARGALVDHAALTDELRSGRLAAVLDVTEPEPLPADSPLFSLPNVVLTPHVAGALGTEVTRLGDAAIDELRRYAAGQPFAHPLRAEDLDRVA
jgi:phosphoglycerate dehydrogenase-like enzyme